MSHDIVVMVSVLPVCAHLGVLRHREWIHAHMMKIELDQNIIPNLVIMYAMCSIMENARKLFDNISIRIVLLWNATIKCHVASGLYEDPRCHITKCMGCVNSQIISFFPLLCRHMSTCLF